jgi:hypothetical protein
MLYADRLSGVVFDKVKTTFYSAWCIYLSDSKLIHDQHQTNQKGKQNKGTNR